MFFSTIEQLLNLFILPFPNYSNAQWNQIFLEDTFVASLILMHIYHFSKYLFSFWIRYFYPYFSYLYTFWFREKGRLYTHIINSHKHNHLRFVLISQNLITLYQNFQYFLPVYYSAWCPDDLCQIFLNEPIHPNIDLTHL